MIQQAFRVFGDGAQLEGRSELSVVHDSSMGDTLLTGQWAHEPLESARRIAASMLEELQEDTEVLDLLTGIREPAEQAVRRLTSPVSVATCFRFASTTFQGLRFLRLVGLAQFGEPDLLVEVEDDIREEQVLELMGHLGHYRLTSNRPLSPGEAIPYGYWLLSVASERLYETFPRLPAAEELAQSYQLAIDRGLVLPPPNVLIEAKDPQRIGEDDWIVGASQALRVLDLQRDAHERIAAICEVDIPFCEPAFSQEPVMLCSRVTSSI